MTDFGRLIRVEHLRGTWPTEAQDFTPWLAREENLALLADTLGIDLELEAVEQNVGVFRADILCKDTLSNSWILIENQLERTDHSHLGQLITYAAGLNAVTIVWIAARVAEEHRAALDWLNEITSTDVRFFALEVELWRIGESPVAPKFNVVCKPNDWSRSTGNAKKAIEDGTLTESRRMLLDYWTEFEQVLPKFSKRVRPVKPLVQNWLVHSLGKSNATLNGSCNRQENWVRAEIYLTGKSAKGFFRALKAEQQQIEHELGNALTWYDGASKDRRIYVTKSFEDVADRAMWPSQHEWLAQNLDALHRVFSQRIRNIDPATPTDEEGA
ncbi:hypothetical protein ABIE69_002749 [Rhodobacteraceae bacterium MBR-64]|jgi:hypothetical protein